MPLRVDLVAADRDPHPERFSHHQPLRSGSLGNGGELAARRRRTEPRGRRLRPLYLCVGARRRPHRTAPLGGAKDVVLSPCRVRAGCSRPPHRPPHNREPPPRIPVPAHMQPPLHPPAVTAQPGRRLDPTPGDPRRHPPAMVQRLPHAGLLPVTQPPPAGHPAAAAQLAGRQQPPRHAGAQHVTMPPSTARSSTQGRPPLGCGRLAGSSGWMAAHTSSGTSCSAMVRVVGEVAMPRDHCAHPSCEATPSGT
jgi:hypothetical protein